jgi:putative MATE family efflux protein
MSSTAIKKNLTEGKILAQIIAFALPLIATSVLHLLFNTADMLVVGRWGGDTQAECEIALGAVGSCAPLISLLVNLFMGLSVGAGVCVAHEIGARHDSEVRAVVSTSVILSLIAGAIVTAVGLIFSPQLLMLMGIEKSLLDSATLYMRAYFVGMPASLLYNFCAAMLRSSGDTTRPLIFLSTAGVVTVVLNLITVLGFHAGALGVGIATAASQWVSCIMIVIFMLKTDGPCKLSLKELSLDRMKLRKIISIGLPAGFQSSLFSISNVIIQSAIQSFGSAAVVAGNTAASNIDGYIYTILNSFATSAMTFTGQHVGAGKYERLKKVLGWHVLLIVGTGIILGVLSFVFAEPLISIFQPGNKAAIDVGHTRLGIIGLTYFTCGIMDMGCYTLRGFGKSLSPTIVSLMGSCVLRIAWTFAVFYPFFGDNIAVLYLSYPITWIVTGGIEAVLVVREVKRRSATSVCR